MLEFISSNFSECVFFAVMLLAMIPTFESKVAIPFAMAQQIWGENALSPGLAFLGAFIGSIIPALFIILISRFVKSKTTGFVYEKFVTKIQNKFKNKFVKIGERKSVFQKCLLLATFVAIPLPLTGVYSGSVIAGFTNLKIWQALISILIGDLFSCLAILLICLFFENSVFYVFLFSLLFVGIYLAISLLIYLIKKIKLLKRVK